MFARATATELTKAIKPAILGQGEVGKGEGGEGKEKLGEIGQG